jgi:molecular chaperone DnaK
VRDPIVGIDLGTSNSVVAAADDNGDPRVLTDSAGSAIQPSVVSFLANGSVLVGAKAKQRRILDPRNTVYSAKRLLGRTFDSREVRAATQRLPFAVKQGVNRQPVVVTRAGELSVPEIAAIVLDHMRGVARDSLETDVSRAVVTVPANATDAQRTATVTAGQIAGIDVVQVLNEPTAAALAYGHRRTFDHVVAVYDFGGGTFDVTLLQVKDAVYEVLATAGDTFLGGDDIDDRMADVMLAQFYAEHRMDLRSDELAVQRLRSVAEQVKIELSRRTKAMVKIDAIAHDPDGQPLDFSVRLAREQLEGEASPIVERSFGVCEEALRMAGLAAARIEAVILVGGTTKMPLVRRKVAAFFGREPRVDVDPDEAVALGAALQGFALWQQRGERARRNTARGAVVPPAPPMEARSASMRSRDDNPWERGSTVPRMAFWEGDGSGVEEVDEDEVDEDDGERTQTVDTMEVPTVAHGKGPMAMPGLRKPGPGTVDYTSRDGRPTAPARPAAVPRGNLPPGKPGAGLPPGKPGAGLSPGRPGVRGGRPGGIGFDSTLEMETGNLDRAGTESDDQDTREDALAVQAPGGRTLRGAGEARPPVLPAMGADASPERGRSILQELDFASLGVEVHGAAEATGSHPIDLNRLQELGRGRPGALPPGAPGAPLDSSPDLGLPDADDSQLDIPTEVAQAGLDRGAGRGAGRGGDRGPGRGPGRGPDLGPGRTADRGPGRTAGERAGGPGGIPGGPGPAAAGRPGAAGQAPGQPLVPALGSAPVSARAPALGTAPVPASGAPQQQLPPGRSEPQRTLQHQAGAPQPARAPTIVEVTPYSLGVGTVAGYCRELLRRNSRVPAEIQEVFTTSRDGQQTVRIRVCQGESRRLDENVILGDLVLDGIEPRPRGETRIAVTFLIDDSGILQVRARDEHTGREQRADLELLGQPSREEVTTATHRVRQLRELQRRE